MTLTELSASLIRVFEGCRLTAYQDTGGVWTIGFGSTHGVTKGLTITQAQAEGMLATDQAQLFNLLEGRPLLEAAALLSFGYDCGIGSLQKVLAGHALLTDFVHDSRGNLLPGLQARRTLEENLILTSQQK